MKINQAFILAAGYGTRLRPLTDTIPKPLIPIKKKPLLAYHLQHLEHHGIKKIIINSFYLSDQIKSFINTYETNISIILSQEEGEILGTAGAVRKQFDILDDEFFIIYGDVLSNVDYGLLVSEASKKEYDMVVVLYHEQNIKEKGMAIIDQDGYIKNFIEKPSEEQIVSDLANAGIYIIKKHIIDQYVPQKGFFDFGKDFFPLLLQNNVKILSYITNAYILDIGTHKNLKKANYDINHIDAFT